MLPKKHRLTRSSDFRRVRGEGRGWSNHMLVLCKLPNELPHSRFGFSVSKRIGGAVVRNRVKRLLREATRAHLDGVSLGWDVVFIARKGIAGANYWAVERSLARLLGEASLLPGRSGHGLGRDRERTEGVIGDAHRPGDD